MTAIDQKIKEKPIKKSAFKDTPALGLIYCIDFFLEMWLLFFRPSSIRYIIPGDFKNST
jgi:hypothetical protein